jgi:hypothetical protein
LGAGFFAFAAASANLLFVGKDFHGEASFQLLLRLFYLDYPNKGFLKDLFGSNQGYPI